MKQKLMLLMIMMILFSVTTFAKETFTKTSFIVSGNCDMCKSRIEKAAKLKGVKSVVWNETSHILTLIFVVNIVSVDEVQQNIAQAGYDTPKFKAEQTSYYNLPQCCHYDRDK